MTDFRHPMDQLRLADPELAAEVAATFGDQLQRVDQRDLTKLVDDTIWGLSCELSFGRAIAQGYTRLMTERRREAPSLSIYSALIRDFGEIGPSVGRLMATHLAAVLLWCRDDLLQQYLKTFDVMYQKGVYTLKAPLECASDLLNSGDIPAGMAYMDLLFEAFSHDMSYNQCLNLTYVLPRAAVSLAPPKRPFQMQALTRVIRIDISLAEALLEGLRRGLNLLSRENLERFIGVGIERHAKDPLMGCRFLSLASKLAAEMCSSLQVAVPLAQVAPRLSRYMRARTGLNITIQPVSAKVTGEAGRDGRDTGVFSDGKSIFLPEEIEIFDNKDDNLQLYLHLAKMESGHFEFGTFDFDCEKALARCSRRLGAAEMKIDPDAAKAHGKGAELACFLGCFHRKSVAASLFTIYEHGRVRKLLARHYPGLVRRSLPVFQHEAKAHCRPRKEGDILSLLYACIALELPLPHRREVNAAVRRALQQMIGLFESEIENDNSVETSALLVFLTFSQVTFLLGKEAVEDSIGDGPAAPVIPFGRSIRPDLILDDHRPYAPMAAAVREKLRQKGIRVYVSDIRKKLIENQGTLSLQDIRDIIVDNGDVDESTSAARQRQAVETACTEWLEVSQEFDINGRLASKGPGNFFQYPEWDCRLNDYLDDHVRVSDKKIHGREGTFYADTLRRYQGLVKKTRRAFELLKPEGLTILRQWLEGDQFDYRALLDFAIDRKAGRIPSDRLYIKRVKQLRDVAVLILVDLSRSTSNKVAGADATVLDVEKEAIILLSEALTVVGDKFAIAGFSGTGRFGVDYLRIKDFSAPADDAFCQRVNAMTPQRSTRMGAAVRHAVRELEKIPARVRVLLMLGDGFPNDVGYKQGYAIADTRKAVHEAYSKQIFFKAITVNIAGDPKLDDLYGHFNHNVISDIRELPDKLLRIYSAMTKM